MDNLAVALARQIESAGEGVARVGATVPRVAIAVRQASIITISVVGTLPRIVPVIVASAAVVILLDAGRAGPTPWRQRVVVMIALALVSIARVPRIACVTVVARIEIEHDPTSDSIIRGE